LRSEIDLGECIEARFRSAPTGARGGHLKRTMSFPPLRAHHCFGNPLPPAINLFRGTRDGVMEGRGLGYRFALTRHGPGGASAAIAPKFAPSRRAVNQGFQPRGQRQAFRPGFFHEQGGVQTGRGPSPPCRLRKTRIAKPRPNSANPFPRRHVEDPEGIAGADPGRDCCFSSREGGRKWLLASMSLIVAEV